MRELNWRLRPVYTRRPAAESREAKNEKLLEDAMAIEPTVTNAITDLDTHRVHIQAHRLDDLDETQGPDSVRRTIHRHTLG